MLVPLALLFVAFACTVTDSPEVTAPAPSPTPEPTAPAATPTPEPTALALTATPKQTPLAATPVAASTLEQPAYCAPAESDTLQEVERTPAGPYFIHHPLTAGPNDPTVIFIPGGNSTRRGAQRLWDTYLSDGEGMEQFRLVVPYSPDETGFMGEARLIVAILDEVLACYGGDAAKVHIAGVSNGGRAAFDVMLSYPARFATLLGAPGLFPNNDAAAWARALGGSPVFNGVGGNDNGWKPGVKATHDALVAEGVASVYVEFADQGHVVNVAFNEDIFFAFWTSH